MTYFAYLVICGAISKNCLQIDDARGPYETEIECSNRLGTLSVEMSKVFMRVNPFEVWVIIPDCKTISNGGLS